jgi:hypothetical protein
VLGASHKNLDKDVVVAMSHGASFDMEIGEHGKHANK